MTDESETVTYVVFFRSGRAVRIEAEGVRNGSPKGPELRGTQGGTIWLNGEAVEAVIPAEAIQQAADDGGPG